MSVLPIANTNPEGNIPRNKRYSFKDSPKLNLIELKLLLSCRCAAISIEAKKGKRRGERGGGRKRLRT